LYYAKKMQNMIYSMQMGGVMLVEFSVKNYKSIAEKQTFSMVAGSGISDLKPHAFETGNSYAPKLTRVACVFGPNGVGKSSFIEALDFFKKFINSSAIGKQEGQPIDTIPFVLSDHFKNTPSEFEIVFIYNGNLYQYGFSADKNRVVDEWMFIKPNKPRTRLKEIYQRNFIFDKDTYDWSFNHLKGQKEFWQKTTRNNALFLSTAVMMNAEMLKDPFRWLVWHLQVIGRSDRLSGGATVNQIRKNDKKEAVLNIMKAADLGIHDLDIGEPDFFNDGFSMEQTKFLKYIALGSAVADIMPVHISRENKNVKIEMSDQSDGTKAIFCLAGPIIDVIQHGQILFVDELHDSLHPHALQFLVGLFQNPDTNPKNAQLIFTGHETSIMARNFLHRDQIWLMEKIDGATSLFPLSDFKGRDYEAFQKAYLDGRYGAVPCIGDFTDG